MGRSAARPIAPVLRATPRKARSVGLFEERNNLLVGRSLRVNGIYVGSVAMLAAMTQNRLEPIIDRVFPFTEAPQALEHLASGSHFGKIVIS